MSNKNYEINVINWDKDKLRKYITLLTIGYFGVKILYGIFNKYSKKPMKEEINNFSTMIIMGSLLYLLTNIDQRYLLGHLNNINWLFFVGYIAGLNIPFFYQSVSNDKDITSNMGIQYLFYGVAIFIILMMLFLGIRSAKENPVYYILYLIVIVFIIMGLIVTRKKSQIYGSTKLDQNMQNILDELSKYFDTDKLIKMIDSNSFREAVKNNNETVLVNIIKNDLPNYDSLSNNIKQHVINLFLSLKKPIMQHGYINTRGTYIRFGMALVGWILSLLFMYDAEEYPLHSFISVFNGMTIGLFVAGTSFYGFEYLLADQKEEECFEEDCKRGSIFKNEQYKDLSASISTIKWGLSLTAIILIIVIILFYTLRF